MSKDDYKEYAPVELQPPEEVEIYRNFSIWQRIGRFFAMRFAWLFAACLALIIIPFVAIACVVNLIIGGIRQSIGLLFYKDSNPEYFIRAGRCALGCLILGFIAVCSLLGIIKPGIPGWFVKKAILIANEVYKWRNKPKLLKERIPHENIDIKAQEETVDTIELKSTKSASAPYQIIFLANASLYEEHIKHAVDLREKTGAHTRVMNYPGVKIYNHQNVHEEPKEWGAWLQKPFRQELPESFNELINAGIAQVYALKKEKKWDWDEVVKQVHLYGHSLGGGVAAQVRKHFIKKHHIKLKTFVDRSYSSFADVSAAQLNTYGGVPFVLAKGLALVALYGAGDWNHDTLASLKKYGGENFKYVNIHPFASDMSAWGKIKKAFGLGNELLADDILPDSAALMTRIEEEAKSSPSTAKILGELADRKGHAVIHVGSIRYRSHEDRLKKLSLVSNAKKSGTDVYVEGWFTSHPSPPLNTAASTQRIKRPGGADG